MEFPSLGEHCQNEECKQKDFLPLQCKCGKVYCREHFGEHCTSGLCEMAPKPKDVNLKNDDEIFRCSSKGCKKGNLHEMLCSKCNKHYCIEHRFHPSCPEIDDETMALKIEQFEAPRKQFHEANKHLQQKITENIRKALQSSAKVKTATKIHLMRIKQKALGPKSIPLPERVYFSIKKPINIDVKSVKIITDVNNVELIETLTLDPDLKDTIPVFISSKWSLGRALDSICDSCNIKNDNNKFGDIKLRVFRQLDGYCISPLKMDVEISDLLRNEILVEGDKLILEYISNTVLNNLDENSHIFLLS
ncbi:PREDICTED: AN1-type zinc finger protein 1-like [Papilio xuthus]|uniref:AN1-type zinc finger protein 1-like n=1 Tax=Papilio xuthus TaxID=66420 RepID=A0AAJ6ZDD2_PAPXU|nr:PREDICTED: AN1-type zinc finger protein 1-like [Papilio xuthus]